jgi:hypothetical protein
VIDWDLNTDKDLHKNRFMAPIPAGNPDLMIKNGYFEEWICYKTREVSAKRLTVYPGQTVVIRDAAPYGIICLQGGGRFGEYTLESPALIRFGQATNDEFFVSADAAQKGVQIINTSDSDNIVILKHFSDNDDLPQIK